MEQILKMRDIERRLRALEIRAARSDFNYVRYESQGGKGTAQVFSFSFETYKKCVLKLSFVVYAKYAPGESGCVKVNGVKVKEFLPKNGKTEVDCYVPFEKGTQGAALYLNSSSEFSVNSCEFEVFGCVDYPEEAGALSVINEQARSVILFATSKRAAIIEYAGEGLNEKLAFDCVGAAVFAYSGGYAVASINSGGALSCKFLSSELIQTNEVEILPRGVISVCAFGGELPCFYAVKGTRVVKLSFNESSLTFSEQVTPYRGKTVSSNPSVAGYLILGGFDGNNKLVAL